jgi:oligopeptide/dipeptide ABC transporter ATP-binding protein
VIGRRTSAGVRSFHRITQGGKVLDVREASVTYTTRSFSVKRTSAFTAVDRVSLEVVGGRSVGVVGESGCGKTSLARSIVNLAPLSGGEISIGERARTNGWHGSTAKRVARSVQMVFQDPFSSLDPRQKVSDAIGEPLVIHSRAARSELRDRVADLLERVGLAEAHASQYPHQLSGGQRQRVCIARSLAVEPSLLVCDEPTSALDVSIQAQVVEVFQHLKNDDGLTYLFITHDLALLPQLTELVAVMYLGRVVEAGPVRDVLHDPRHPYTSSLVAAAPILGHARAGTSGAIIAGDAVADDSAEGCPFRQRCWLHRRLGPAETARCVTETPEQIAMRPAAPRAAACHFAHYVPDARSAAVVPSTPVAVRSRPDG